MASKPTETYWCRTKHSLGFRCRTSRHAMGVWALREGVLALIAMGLWAMREGLLALTRLAG